MMSEVVIALWTTLSVVAVIAWWTALSVALVEAVCSSVVVRRHFPESVERTEGGEEIFGNGACC